MKKYLTKNNIDKKYIFGSWKVKWYNCNAIYSLIRVSLKLIFDTLEYCCKREFIETFLNINAEIHTKLTQ